MYNRFELQKETLKEISQCQQSQLLHLNFDFLLHRRRLNTKLLDISGAILSADHLKRVNFYCNDLLNATFVENTDLQSFAFVECAFVSNQLFMLVSLDELQHLKNGIFMLHQENFTQKAEFKW